MKDFDTLIKNGNVVLPDSIKTMDIGIKDGRIKELGTSLHGTFMHAYDAENRYIFPGAVDVHVHFNEPGRTDWEGFASGSRMMAAGGCTTYFDMPLNGIPSTTTPGALREKRALGRQKSVVDFGLWGGLVPGNEEELAALAEEGAVGFKAFLLPPGNPEFEGADDRTLLRGMQRIAELGKILALHAESAPIIDFMQEQQTGTGPDSHLQSRPVEAESEAVERALYFARLTGCPLHFVHISNAETIDIIERAKQEGMDITVETCAHYLLFSHDILYTRGAAGKCAPPLRSEEERRALVQCLLDGKIDMVSSDHSPCPPELKDTDNMLTAWGGINGGQFTLSVLLETALRHHEPLTRVAAWSAAAPAGRFDMEETKGTIEEGKAADFTVVDLHETHTVTTEDLYTKHQQSLYTGHEFPCRVKQTFQRGTLVYNHQAGILPHSARS